MKSFKLFSLLLAWVLSYDSYAQISLSSQPETLLRNNNLGKKVRFMVSPTFGFTTMDGSAASLLSLRGGAVLNDKLTIGGFYSLSVNQIRPESETVPNIYMDYRAGGGFIEYTAFSNKLLHVTFPLFIGSGEVEMDNESGSGAAFGEQNFLLIEPSVMAELNLHKHVRLNFGTGYRLASNMNYRNFNQANISGLTGYVGLKFGLF